MPGRAEGSEPPAIHGNDATGQAVAPAPDAAWLGEEWLRLETERRMGQASLNAPAADLRGLEIERDRLEDAVAPDPAVRLRLLAGMGGELRTSLHGILGYLQMFRMRGGLDEVQIAWVDAMLAAGTSLLGQVYTAVSLADAETPPRMCSIEDVAPVDIVPRRGSAPSAGAAGSTRSGAPEADGYIGLQVLIAEDVAMNREIASAFMRAAGHFVTMAETGRGAVDAARSADFDVILMDIRMPDMDGLVATRQIRALPGVRGRVPIIALTAQASADRIAACREAGMNGHLAKPFRYTTLNGAIRDAAAKGMMWRHPRAHATVPCFLAPAAATIERGPGMLPRAAGQAWLDIDSPWNAEAGAQRVRPDSGRAYILDTQFKLKLMEVGTNGHRQLVDAVRSCVPPRNRDQYEFHWLLYTDASATALHVYSAVCDLWRWSGSAWRSISVPGASFSADEMYEQGWRYCGPCFEKTAMVEVG